MSRRNNNNNFQMNNNNNKDVQKKANIFESFKYLDDSSDSDNEGTVKEVQEKIQEPEKVSVLINEEPKSLFELKPVTNITEEEGKEMWTKVKSAPKYKPSLKINSEREQNHEHHEHRENHEHREYREHKTFGDKKQFHKKFQEIEQEQYEEKEETTIKPEQAIELEEETEDHEDGSEMKLMNKWYVWTHEIDSKDWSPKSYKIAHTIDTIANFWKFFNNISKLNHWKFNFFIMKENSHPTWEHSSNRNGGTCSFRIDVGQCIDVIEQLSMLVLNESISDENDLNGISFAAKGNWSVIKIWNRDNKNNISNHMPSYLRKIYPSISIKYKENTPEY